MRRRPRERTSADAGRAARPGRRGAASDAPSGVPGAHPPSADEPADDSADPNAFERINARTTLRLFCRDRVAVELALITGWFPTDCADDAATVRLWAEPTRWAGTDPGPNAWRVQAVLGGAYERPGADSRARHR